MIMVVFKWVDEDGPNQYICLTLVEIVEFIWMNIKRIWMFRVEVW
jgi:hypothetical protein